MSHARFANLCRSLVERSTLQPKSPPPLRSVEVLRPMPAWARIGAQRRVDDPCAKGRPVRLLIVVIDAVEPTLLRRWAADRTLPNIRQLIDRGTSGEVRGVEGLIHSTWPSFYTGLNPGGHGVYRASQLDSGSYEFFRPRDRPGGTGGTPLWTLASDAGR